MILYVTLGTTDVPAAVRFYDAVLGPLGFKATETTENWAAYGPEYGEGVSMWVCKPFDGAPMTPGNGTMVAFPAASAAAVDAFHAAALGLGGADEGAPGPRPHYGPHFYAAYVRDPDGNKLACVCYTWNRATGHSGTVNT
jgi:catechol 2,3-dioxygenase-like lactoylglutathione lyase family enzyme